MPVSLLKTARPRSGFAAACVAFGTLILLLLPGWSAAAQDFEFSPYGFVKAEYIYDTRQVLQVREGEFNLFPLPESEATDTDNLGFFDFFSRLGLTVSGPEVLGADASARFEADFFGADDAGVSNFRVRRATVNLDYGTYAVLFGREWSPMFTLAVFPQTVNTTTGAPFNPFSRQTQIRFTYKPGGYQLIGALAQQRDAFDERGLAEETYPGLDGSQITISETSDGEKLQQQAGLPGLHLHAQLVPGENAFGVGAHAKWIRPDITGDRFLSGAFQAYAKVVSPSVELRAKATYGNDLSDHLMLGGYIETVPDGDLTTLDAGAIEYLPTRLFSAWLDVQSTAPLAVGLFAGYQTQLGVGAIDDGRAIRRSSALAPDIDYLLRVAPRLVLTAGPVSFGFELEVTSALYASEIDQTDYTPDPADDDEAVTNVRGNLSVFYSF